MLDPGEMRHRLTLRTVSRATSAATGEQTHTWSTATTLWASVVPLSGREVLRADAPIGEMTHRVTCRYRAAIVPTARFAWGSRTLEIVSVSNVGERNTWCECVCKEVV